MSWRKSLIRISTYEIETLQRRLADVVERRSSAELRLVVLEAEAEAEILFADRDAEAGWYRAGFLAATRTRRAALHRLSASPPQVALPAAHPRHHFLRRHPLQVQLAQRLPAPGPRCWRTGSACTSRGLRCARPGRSGRLQVMRLQLGQHLAGPLQHLGRDAGQLGDVDAVALVGAARRRSCAGRRCRPAASWTSAL